MLSSWHKLTQAKANRTTKDLEKREKELDKREKALAAREAKLGTSSRGATGGTDISVSMREITMQLLSSSHLAALINIC